jgi:hypothetical protein
MDSLEKSMKPYSTEGGDSETQMHEQPVEELELAVARVWEDIFGIAPIGRNDNFFGLGGDSVVGLELMELMAERLGVRAPIVLLFQYPSVRELSEIIRAEFTPAAQPATSVLER